MSGIIGGAGSKSGVIGTTELDYEEGEWTPTLTGGGSVSVAWANYTKIGRLVHVAGKLSKTSVTTDGTTITIGALPFTAAEVGDNNQRSALRPEGDWNGCGIAFSDGAHFRVAGDTAQGVKLSGTGSAYWAHSDSGSSIKFNFSGTYYCESTT